MKSRITLEVNESDILNSIATQSNEDVFGFVDKILNNHDYPSEVANELISHLEDYIDGYQRNEYEHQLVEYVNDAGELTGKYKEKQKIRQPNKKVKIVDSDKSPT